MPLRPPQPVPITQRDWDQWARRVPIVADPDSVGTGQVKGAKTAHNDNFYVKRAGEMTFDTISDSDIPAGITRDVEMVAADAAVTAAFTAADDAHAAASDPHPGYVLESTILNGSATYDPASLNDGVGATTTVTVTGAALGDFALASFSLDLQGITVSAYVSAPDTVAVRFQNESGGTLDLASGTLKARVWK